MPSLSKFRRCEEVLKAPTNGEHEADKRSAVRARCLRDSARWVDDMVWFAAYLQQMRQWVPMEFGVWVEKSFWMKNEMSLWSEDSIFPRNEW